MWFGFPKNIFFLGLTSLFNDFSSEMVLSAFPAFFTSVLKSGAGSLGLVEGIADAASNIFKIYSGRLSDKLQKRKFLVVSGYALSTITRPFYLLAGSITGVGALRFLDRTGKGLRDAPRDAIISLSVAKKDLGRSFGYHRTMDTLGGILGPLTAFFILSYFPLRFDILFMTAFVVGLVAIVTLVFIKDIPASLIRDIAAPHDGLSREFTLYLASVFLLSVGALPIAVLLLKTQSLGLTLASIPLFYMLYSISYSVFAIPAGKLSDRVGPRKVIAVGYSVLIIGYAALALATSPWALATGFLLLGLFPALTDGVQRSLAAQLSGEASRGRAYGFMNAAVGVGALVAGAGGGYLWQIVGPGAAFIAASAVIILGLAIFFIAAAPRYSRLA